MPLVLRDYQELNKQKIYSEWQAGRQNVLLQLPTGGGKTKTFCSIAMDMALGGSRMPTAIQVHRKELVQQISLTLAEEAIPHNIIAPRETIIGIIASQRRWTGKQFYDYNSPITVVSVDTLNARILKYEKWAKSIKLWIVDEAAHLLKNNKWGRAVSYFPNAYGLGVTATPERLDKRGLGRHADGVFDVMVQGPSTRWLIENGYLCQYKIAVPQSDYKKFLKEASGNSDYTREAMALASSQSHILGDVVTNYLKFANGKQSILFASDIENAEKMEKNFLGAGVPAKLLTGETPDKERLDAMIDYRDKRTKVLINVDLFDEGLDVPGIECVQMARPTMSLGKYLQMIGRGLRPAKDKPYLTVIDHVGNVPEHGLPDSPRRWTLDRVIRRSDRTNLIRICGNIHCNSPYDRAESQCPYCGEKFVPNRSGGGDGSGRLTLKEVDGDLELLDRETLEKMYESAELETPAEVARRVSHVAGKAAGIKAAKNQQERINVQKDLAELLAQWAGCWRHLGYSDRYLHKQFYLTFDMTMSFALSEPTEAMRSTIEKVTYDLGRFGYGVREANEKKTTVVV